MSDGFKFELNEAGIAELMQSPEMTAIIQQHTSRVNANAGAGYESNVITGKKRAVGRVWAESADAKRDNSDNNILLKALH